MKYIPCIIFKLIFHTKKNQLEGKPIIFNNGNNNIIKTNIITYYYFFCKLSQENYTILYMKRLNQ